jgi:hypothetical protein
MGLEFMCKSVRAREVPRWVGCEGEGGGEGEGEIE